MPVRKARNWTRPTQLPAIGLTAQIFNNSKIVYVMAIAINSLIVYFLYMPYIVSIPPQASSIPFFFHHSNTSTLF